MSDRGELVGVAGGFQLGSVYCKGFSPLLLVMEAANKGFANIGGRRDPVKAVGVANMAVYCV